MCGIYIHSSGLVLMYVQVSIYVFVFIWRLEVNLFFTESGTHQLSRFVRLCVPGSLLSFILQCQSNRCIPKCLVFYLNVGCSKSSLHICAAGWHFTKPSPHPNLLF